MDYQINAGNGNRFTKMVARAGRARHSAREMANQLELYRQGIATLQQGNAIGAMQFFRDAANAGPPQAEIHLAMNAAALTGGAYDEALAAADRAIAINPNLILGMLAKADALEALGRQREATAFYASAIQHASAGDQANPQISSRLQAAQQKCINAAGQYEEVLREKAQALGLSSNGGHTRADQAMAILLGKQQIYHQQPEKFYFPELPQRQFYDARAFDWTADIIAATDTIKDELENLLSSADHFEPYVPRDSKTPHVTGPLVGSDDWGAFHLIKDGITEAANAERCPKTMAALANVPAPDVAGKSPIALFSRLKPGAHITPHTGLMNTRLICHLPLITPPGCQLRVGNQVREWRNGEMLIFDDSIEHEARNPTNADRIILLFDIWRPELDEDERAFVKTMFEAIEAYGAG